MWAQEAPAEPPAEAPAEAPAEVPAAEPAAPEAPAADEGFALPQLAIHGFVSQGAFVSTENDYLGYSERGSFEFLEAAINVSTEVADRLRAGAQLFTRDLGPLGNYNLVLDWAYLDYKWRDWLGLRAGRIKTPFGLYNEFVDIDAARLPILLPQSVYPSALRDFLLAQTGFSLYGSLGLGRAGGLDYQVFGGQMFIETGTFDLGPLIEVREIDGKFAAGGQLFWRTPLPGLRLGASYQHTNIAFQLQVDLYAAALLQMLGRVPEGFDGSFQYQWSDINLAVGSIEYTRDDWLFAAEYSRWTFDVDTSIPDAVRESEEDQEKFYGMVAYRFTPWLEAGTYYSVIFLNADDRDGSNRNRFTESHRGYRKDLALSTRLDINDHWLWKLEAHYMDGTAELADDDPIDPDNLAEHWGFFLVKTTVTF